MQFRRFLRNESLDSAIFRLLPTVAPIGAGTLTGSRGEALTFTRGSSSACLTAADASTLVTLTADQPAVEPTGLLMQPSTTNLSLRSEQFDNAAWQQNLVTVTANTHVAPDGTTTGDTIAGAGATSWIQSASGSAITWSGTIGTISVWVRSVTGTATFDLYAFDNTASAYRIRLQNQTATTTWQRFTASSATFVNGNVVDVGIEWATSGASTIVAWGFQAQGDAALSSYIATTTAAATRAADKLVWTANVTLTTRPRFTAIVYPQKVTAGGNRYLLVARASTANDEWEFLLDTSGHVNLYCAVGGVVKGPATSTGVVTANAANAVAGWYDGSKLWVSLNGAVDSASVAFTAATAMTAFSFGSYIDATAVLQGNIRDVAIYP